MGVVWGLFIFSKGGNRMTKPIDHIADYWNRRAPTFDADHDTENLDGWRRELARIIGEPANKKTLDIGRYRLFGHDACRAWL